MLDFVNEPFSNQRGSPPRSSRSVTWSFIVKYCQTSPCLFEVITEIRVRWLEDKRNREPEWPLALHFCMCQDYESTSLVQH